MALAQPNGTGGWVRGDDIPLKGGFDLAQIPSQAVIPAGEYGIVQFRCSRYKYNGV
jgi:hypothetical protein